VDCDNLLQGRTTQYYDREKTVSPRTEIHEKGLHEESFFLRLGYETNQGELARLGNLEGRKYSRERERLGEDMGSQVHRW
jgi:hypothetical protein